MQIKDDRAQGIPIVTPIGRIDSRTSPILERHLAGLVAAGDRRAVIDLASVDYINSAGLRVMLSFAKKIKDLGGSLALCAMVGAVHEVFALAGFLSLFAIEPSREAAVARIAAP